MRYEKMENLKMVAAMAMHAIIAKHPPYLTEEGQEDYLPAQVARGAFEYAEAFMAEFYERTNATDLAETDGLEAKALHQEQG